MEQSPSRDNRQLALLMLGAFVLMFVPALFSRGPWHVDDLRYVEAARQMGEYGDYLVPRLNGEVYGEKPPGYSWAVVAVHTVTRADYLVSARIVAALTALLTGLLLVHLARVLFGKRDVGWIAAGFFWSFVFILDRGTRSLIDSFLYFWTTLGVVTLLHAALADNWRARLGWIAATVGALGYGCIVKGPVALAIPALGILVLGLTWKGRKGVCFTALLVGALAGGLLTLLWLWLASRQVGEWYLERLLFKQSAGRAVESFHHAEPVWFYVGVILPVALPWIVFLPGAVRAAWKMRHAPEARAALGVLGWAAAIFLFFSVISGKRSGYVLPLFPPLALGIAWGVSRMQVLQDRVWLRWPTRLLGWVAVLAGVATAIAALVLATMPRSSMTGLPADALQVINNIPLAGVIVLAGTGVIAALWASMLMPLVKRGSSTALVLMIPLIGIFQASIHLAVIPAIDSSRSAASFGEQVNAQWNRDQRLVVLGSQKDGIVTYYCDVQSVDSVSDEELQQTTGPIWVVSLRKDWERLPQDFRAPFAERASADFNSKEYVLFQRR
ncbi:MAG: glycosyltransferase family 39 protein [Planctomycetes bacterium]|nr:glycosyltransferase family 39 protein [Planctomycetota bacterium]